MSKSRWGIIAPIAIVLLGTSPDNSPMIALVAIIFAHVLITYQ